MSNLAKKSFMLSLCLASFLYANEVKTDSVITVTANKIEENLQDVPQSISVIDGETLQERSMKNIRDIIREVPNMSSHSTAHGNQVNFRGLNESMFTGNNPVVIYIDGIPTTNAYFFDVPLNNVERVEVLRGPQGTLYGKDAIGAVINIVTKEPSNKIDASVGLEYGSYNTINALANIQGPFIKDKLFFGINARGFYSDSYITNDYNNDKKAAKNDKKQFNAFLLARPLDNLSVKLNLFYDDKNSNMGIIQALSALTPIDEFSRKGSKHQTRYIPEKTDITRFSQSLNINYELDKFDIISIITHKKDKEHTKMGSFFGTMPSIRNLTQGLDLREEEYSGEFRLQNKDENIKWLMGLYLDKTKNKFLDQYMQSPIPTATGAFADMTMLDDAIQDSKTMALFGQIDFPILDKLDLTLGARAQRFKKEIDSKFYMYPINSPKPINSPINVLETSKTWDTILPKLALNYKITSNLNSYISISKGYMPGGFNYFAMSGGPKENTFKAQSSIDYELGIKGDFEDLRFSANIFRMDIKDIHVMKIGSAGQYFTDNAKKAHSQGVEFDFNYYPTNELELSGAFAFIDAKYDDYFNGKKQFKRERIENTPRYTANLGLGYYHPRGFYGRIDGNYRGKTSFFNAAKSEFVSAKGGVSADIKLGYKLKDLDLYLYGKNITNADYLEGYMNRGDLAIASFNDPREFGLGFRYKF